MPSKSFSLYHSGGDFTVSTDDKLVIEVGRSHVACILVQQAKKLTAAFEFFTFNEKGAFNFRELFKAISDKSMVLGKTNNTRAVINNALCLPVPIFKFNKEIAPDYLNVVFGEDYLSEIQYEHVAIEPGIMNVFRVDKEVYNTLVENIPGITFSHTWSGIINAAFAHSPAINPEYISVQFYNEYFIAVVVKNGMMQLVQSFIYEVPEDVLYYLLNICKRFDLNNNTLTLDVSGFFDLDFKLYEDLMKYFRNVVVKSVDKSKALMNIEYPLHYFTPFFNLGL